MASSYRYGQVTVKKFPSMRSLVQSAARSDRQSKTWKAPGPASSIAAWMAAVKLSKPTVAESWTTLTPGASSTSGAWRAKRK